MRTATCSTPRASRFVGVIEPFAGFADGPVARAVRGAARLDTLVVVPAGNEGPAGPSYGSIGGPGGAPAALTVGAADLRRQTATVRVVVRAGLRTLLDRELPLAGAAAPGSLLSLAVTRPRRTVREGPRSEPLGRWFDDAGYSIVAGRAALLARATGPADEAREAVAAGAAAILVDGVVPAGALGIDDRLDVPVVGLPGTVAASLSALARGVDVRVQLGATGWRPNDGRATVAPFSSQGLAFGGGVKPGLATAGVELVTADPGRNLDRTARYGTISGTSAATALAGRARPSWRRCGPGSTLPGSRACSSARLRPSRRARAPRSRRARPGGCERRRGRRVSRGRRLRHRRRAGLALGAGGSRSPTSPRAASRSWPRARWRRSRA